MKQYRDSWQFVLLAASIEERFFTWSRAGKRGYSAIVRLWYLAQIRSENPLSGEKRLSPVNNLPTIIKIEQKILLDILHLLREISMSLGEAV